MEMRNLKKRGGEDREAMRSFYKHLFRGKGQYLLALAKASRFIYPFYSRIMKMRIGGDDDLRELVETLGLEVIVHPTVLEGLFIND